MENRILGLLLIIMCVMLGGVIFAFHQKLNAQTESSCSCTEMEQGGFCPHQEQSSWQTYLGIILTSLIAALGIYLIFFEKSQKEILSTLENQKHIQIEDEKFNILLKGLDQDEQKVIKAVKEQEGITQQTLRLRTDMHKSKLSIVIAGLEKKGLVKKVAKGKTNQLYLKIGL
ncbi:MAG: hypothetical protein ABIG95_03510 [Candidatus Woesearchaeota archaeon]